jgi:ankyrin repeat protein
MAIVAQSHDKYPSVTKMSRTSVMSKASLQRHFPLDKAGNQVSLGIVPFTPAFDRHFRVSSEKMVILLNKASSVEEIVEAGEHQCDVTFSRKSVERHLESMAEWKTFFMKALDDARFWGFSVHKLVKFWEFVAADLQQYSYSHGVNNQRCHVCWSQECRWHHSDPYGPVEDMDQIHHIKQLPANMHLVVSRYVKPWTEKFENAGLALMLNAGSTSTHRTTGSEHMCRAQVFISHSWSEEFELFVKSMLTALGSDAVVWVCSFAIWQHGEIATMLHDLDSCPFVIAMRDCPRVLAVTDETCHALTRCWCVLEAHFAYQWSKSYDICLNDDADPNLWQAVDAKVRALDIKQCDATKADDKVAILKYVSETVTNGIEGLNDAVRAVSDKARLRSTLHAAALCGHVSILQTRHITEITAWRNVRGRTLTHVTAAAGRIAALLWVVQATRKSQLNTLDLEGNSPITVSALEGSTSGIQLLIEARALVDGASVHGMSPLCFAAAGGHANIAYMLLEAEADVEFHSTYMYVRGRRPLHIAAREGHDTVAGLLLVQSADVRAVAGNGLTTLNHAIAGDHLHTIEYLITQEADVNQANEDEAARVPLMYAIQKHSPAIINLLLSAKADVDVTDTSGLSCVDYAKHYHMENNMGRTVEQSPRGSRKIRKSKPSIRMEQALEIVRTKSSRFGTTGTYDSETSETPYFRRPNFLDDPSSRSTPACCIIM